MSHGLKGLLSWAAGVAGVLTVLSGASLAALTALAAVPATGEGAVVSAAPGPGAASPAGAPPIAATSPLTAAISADRAVALRHLLVQDCGSCHGLTLGGGLGPPLQPALMVDRPVPYLAYVILHGRPGTAMPPWSALLTELEGEWLARELRGENP